MNNERVEIRNDFKPLIAAIERVVEIPIPRATVFCETGSHRSADLAGWLFFKNIVSLTKNNLMGGKIVGCSHKHSIRTLVAGSDLAIFCFFNYESDDDRYFRPQVRDLLANCHRIDVITTGTTCYSRLKLQTR